MLNANHPGRKVQRRINAYQAMTRTVQNYQREGKKEDAERYLKEIDRCFPKIPDEHDLANARLVKSKKLRGTAGGYRQIQ